MVNEPETPLQKLDDVISYIKELELQNRKLMVHVNALSRELVGEKGRNEALRNEIARLNEQINGNTAPEVRE